MLRLYSERVATIQCILTSRIVQYSQGRIGNEKVICHVMGLGPHIVNFKVNCSSIIYDLVSGGGGGICGALRSLMLIATVLWCHASSRKVFKKWSHLMYILIKFVLHRRLPSKNVYFYMYMK